MITKIHTKTGNKNQYFRVPTWDWVNEARVHNKFSEEVMMGYNRYNNVAPNVNDDIGVALQSMSGTGLGYWGNDAFAQVELAHFIRGTVVEVVS